MERIRDSIRRHGRVIILGGAGMSASAGSTQACTTDVSLPLTLPVPPFRGPHGVFETEFVAQGVSYSAQRLLQYENEEPHTKHQARHDFVKDFFARDLAARPTIFHEWMFDLASKGTLVRLLTQNIDTLDTKHPKMQTTTPLRIGDERPIAVKLHGRIDRVRCNSDCGYVAAFKPDDYTKVGSFRCQNCGEGGPLRPDVLLYDDPGDIDAAAIQQLVENDVADPPGVFIVTGTTLAAGGETSACSATSIARRMCKATKQKGGITVWLNLQNPPRGFDFDVVLCRTCDDFATIARTWD